MTSNRMSLDLGLDEQFLPVPCTHCSFEMEVIYLQMRLEETVICPCCKWNIRLVDQDASVEVSKREVDEAFVVTP